MRDEVVQIMGETLKSAMGAEIMRAFPGTTWYKESVINLKFPHFFVFQITMSTERDRKNFWQLRGLMNVRYRAVAEPSTLSTLQEHLDNIGLKMLSDIQTIKLGSFIIRVKNARYEKADGILQYFCNIEIQVTKELEEQVKQGTLEINEFIKEVY